MAKAAGSGFVLWHWDSMVASRQGGEAEADLQTLEQGWEGSRPLTGWLPLSPPNSCQKLGASGLKTAHEFLHSGPEAGDGVSGFPLPYAQASQTQFWD